MNALVILVPVLGRPHRVRMVLDGFARTTPDARLCFIPDPDDQPEIDAIEAAGGEILTTLKANYATKINTGVKMTDEPLIFLGADDLVPSEDWFEQALSHMQDGVEVVGVNDMLQRGRHAHATHFLITRRYAELPTITGERGPLCEVYDHSCTDDELIATAKHRNAYIYAADAHVTHLHPDNATAPIDDTYRRGRRQIRRGSHDLEEPQDVVLGAEVLMSITVVIGTYGDDIWREYAKRAIASAKSQAPVIHVHGDNLADARNKGLAKVETEHVVHLDADDTLLPGYVNAMLRGTADVRVPMVRNMRNNYRKPYSPNVYGHSHSCEPTCLLEGNYIVVGAAVRTELVREVGGWWDEPLYEDWSLFLRCQQAGATFEHVTDAVYGFHSRPDSRNHSGPAYEQRHYWHQSILDSIVGAA